MPRLVGDESDLNSYDVAQEIAHLHRRIDALARKSPTVSAGKAATENLVPLLFVTAQKVGGDPSFDTTGFEFGDGFTVQKNGQNGFATIAYVPPAVAQQLMIGQPVIGGDEGSLLLVSGGSLSQDGDRLKWDPIGFRLTVGDFIEGSPLKPLYVTERNTASNDAKSVIEVARVASGAVSSQFGAGISFAGAVEGSGLTTKQMGAVIARINTDLDHTKLEFYVRGIDPATSLPAELDVAYIDDTGNLALIFPGGLIQLKEGTNCAMGQVTLVAGTVDVNTTKVATNSRIHLTRAVSGGTLGHLAVGTITAGTKFVINSSSATDTSTINWIMFAPSP
jgi:hypothetical protein